MHFFNLNRNKYKYGTMNLKIHIKNPKFENLNLDKRSVWLNARPSYQQRPSDMASPSFLFKKNYHKYTKMENIENLNFVILRTESLLATLTSLFIS
jgi:hypothetical protein